MQESTQVYSDIKVVNMQDNTNIYSAIKVVNLQKKIFGIFCD